MTSRFRRAAIVVALLTLLVTLPACTTTSEANVTTTNDDAHSQLIGYMHANAEALPPQATLARTIPGLSTSTLKPSPVPCNQDDDDPEQPYRWNFDLWALLPDGVTAEQTRAALEQSWRDRKFDIQTRDSDTIAETDDGYLFVTQIAAGGYLSVGIQSPCFPKSQLNRSMSWPESVSR